MKTSSTGSSARLTGNLTHSNMKTNLDDIKIRANSVTPDKIDDDWYYHLDDSAKQQIKDLFFELTNDEYEAAYNRSDSDPVYVALVRIRERINAL